jgi:hypothetical protein
MRANFTKLFTVLFIFSLLFSIVAKFEFLSAYGMHPDVNLTFTPTRAMLNGDGLKSGGMAIPMVVVRDNKMPAYSYNYMGPILFYAPFIQLLGSGTIKAFALGQLFLMFIFAGILLFYRSPSSKILLGSALLSLAMMFTFNESILDCPTQLQLFILLAVFWRLRQELLIKPYLAGIILAIAYQFRPESLALMLGFFVYGYLCSRKSFGKNVVQTIIAFTLIYLLFNLLRYALGAQSGADHILYVLGSDIITARDAMADHLDPHKLSDLVSLAGLQGLMMKIFNRTNQFLNFRHALTWRPEMLFTWIFLALSALYWAKQTIEERRDSVFITVVALGVYLLSAIGWNDQRYFDVLAVLAILFAMDNFEFYKRNFDFASYKAISIVLCYLLLVVNLNSFTTHKNSKLIKQEESFCRAGQALATMIPNKHSRVISNKCELWNWYAGGSECVYYGSMVVDKRLLAAYKPEAAIFFPPFKNNQFNLGGLKPDLSLMQQGIQVVVFK